MKCPSCNEETRGFAHNNRGVFCTHCMFRLPLLHPEPEMVVVKEEPPPLPLLEPELEKIVVAKPKRKSRPREKVAK